MPDGEPIAAPVRHRVPDLLCMKHFQIDLLSYLLICWAVPLWVFLSWRIVQSAPGGPWLGGWVLTPLVLSGITAALHRLLRPFRSAWALAALLAAVIVLCALYGAAAVVQAS